MARSRILGALVCGVVIGAVGVMSLPGAAHHSRDERRLKNRVARLEALVEDLDATVDAHATRLGGHDIRLGELRIEVDELTDKTQELNASGTYLGEILNRQVVVPLSICQHLDDAVFGDDPNDNRDVAYLGCVRGSR